MALCKRERRLTSLQRNRATSIEVRFRGHKGDQAQQGWVIVRTRDDASLRDAFHGRSRRRCRRSHGEVAVGLSDIAGTCPPCRRIGMATKLRCGGTRRPSGHFGRWYSEGMR